MKVIPVFFIFILATSCSTFKVPVMARQLKVSQLKTIKENHSCDRVVFFTCTLVLFHFKETSLLSVLLCQLPHFSTNYMPADTKLYDYIILLFTK